MANTETMMTQMDNMKEGILIMKDLDPRVTVHYGIPSTASVLAFDPIQRLLAVGTLDGRIKVIGGDNIEGLFVSPKQLPFKNLEFLRNQGFLVSVSNENEIQVWDLEHRRINSTLRWESNITAFSVIRSTSYMYLGDEYGMVSVLKYDAEEGKFTQLPYYVPTDVIAEGTGISSSNQIFCCWSSPPTLFSGLLIAYDNGLIVLWDVSDDKVVLMLCLDWSSGIESLKCVGRVDLTLSGSFADMVLLPSLGGMESCGTLLFVLSNPGQLDVYDDAFLSSLMSRKEKGTSASSLQYPMVISTIEPYMTVGKLGLVYRDGKFSRDLSKEVSAAKVQASHTPSATLTGSMKWPLTGGVPCQFNDTEGALVERLYVAGYQDGSVRIWDATYAALSLIYVLGSELAGFKTASASAPVSALEFCSSTLSLAIGNACCMISLYKLIRSSNETSLTFVTEAGKEGMCRISMWPG
ncbi:hypothetical protein Dsin_001045 [Dipteronia sinensis]|uniref:Uncharacterized protein n=1 Tax=Dipteronia sinensis TaxID=43782 RepID=A0AAE0EID0_9ROSI|nr:hypothetical protein Dsin_001045 [Dipteronia sinensis]